MSENAFVHHGRLGAVIRLSVVNALLNIVTLALWRFWGKTRVRAYLWGHTTIWGEPLEYVGRGGELFIGFLLAMLVVFTPYMILVSVAQFMLVAENPWGALLFALAQFALFFLIGVGLYRARRYLMTRTIWRGLRAGQDGSALTYALLILGHIVLMGLTLGWSAPWMSMKIERYQLNHTRFGDTGFQCTATSASLYKRYALVWFSFIPVIASMGLLGLLMDYPDPDAMEPGEFFAKLALVYVWLFGSILLFTALPLAAYNAAYWRQIAAHTRFDGIGFSFDLGAWRLLRLFVGNGLITTLSLGILRPVASMRTLRTACQCLSMDSQPDLARLFASTQPIPRTGEGLVAALDGVGEF